LAATVWSHPKREAAQHKTPTTIKEITMTEIIAGITIPDSAMASEATELVRDVAPPLLFHHSRRVFLFGSLQGQRLGTPRKGA
jgi:hypothetical protein